MGTQRVEAFLQCGHLTAMETSDYALMIVICHRWNDAQLRDLDIRFPVLLDLMPYRNGTRPERMLRTSIDRLVKTGLLRVAHNGARYLRDRWMHIAIVDEKFHGNLAAIRDRARERRTGEPAQARLLQSRALSDQIPTLDARPESTRAERSNSDTGRASRKSTRAERSDSDTERASHSSVKISKDHTAKKDPPKAAPLPGDLPATDSDSALAETAGPMPARQAWQCMIAQMGHELPVTTFETWLRGIVFVREKAGHFHIRVPNAYTRRWIEQRAVKRMIKELSGLTGRTVHIDLLLPHEAGLIDSRAAQSLPVLP
ncbi:MAG: hypothetical protein F4X14_18230 [Caldilineaceae bacterium SB0661_bin_32]|uniref:DnaA N-terminal domain-containing protein n=1 Tax=Caldilineaceae bacterium SB0661_bin_32 TaxID=2605255 RepID=A0A6B1DBY3_9CHLR|nr:hypothetical protein [Caldilineaceae bacterium SB0661_bin_32]